MCPRRVLCGRQPPLQTSGSFFERDIQCCDLQSLCEEERGRALWISLPGLGRKVEEGVKRQLSVFMNIWSTESQDHRVSLVSSQVPFLTSWTAWCGVPWCCLLPVCVCRCKLFMPVFSCPVRTTITLHRGPLCWPRFGLVIHLRHCVQLWSHGHILGNGVRASTHGICQALCPCLCPIKGQRAVVAESCFPCLKTRELNCVSLVCTGTDEQFMSPWYHTAASVAPV